jgi:hypothetical protein
MERLTLGSIKADIARAVGICEDDARVAGLVNEAQKRLVNKGKWWGTTARYRVCVNDACLVWPRQIDTIEAFAICSTPGTIKSGWYEFLGHGPGILKETSSRGNLLVDKDPTCAYDAILGTDKKVRVFADVAEAAGSQILLQGYDENGQWIRTLVSGAWIDGVYVDILTTGAVSSVFISSLTGAIKPQTNGPVRLYEFAPATGVQRQIAYYESDETRPVYRASFVPGIEDMGACTDATCSQKAVTVLAKLRPMPVAGDNDWLLLGNAPAIKLMVMAIRKEENDHWAEAQAYETKAVQLLEEELSAHMGDGMVVDIRVQNDDWMGAGMVAYSR